MKKNNTKKNEFEGLALDEAISSHIVKAGQTLVLKVALKDNAKKLIVESGVYEKRADGIFSLEVALPGIGQPEVKPSFDDLVAALFEHDDAPEWLLDNLWETLNNHTNFKSYDPDYIKLMLKHASGKWSAK